MEFRPEYGRPPPEFYRGVDYPDYHRDYPDHRTHDYLDFAQQRARSHNRLDPEYIPSDFATYNRPLDKSTRSKSLDHREAFRDDHHFSDDRRGINIPIYRERNDRNYDYERDVLYTPFVRKEDRADTIARSGPPYSREVDIPLKRTPRALTRSTEWLSRRFDDRPRNPRDVSRTEGYSPKSASSSKRHNLNVAVDPGRVRRDYGRAEDYVNYAREDGRDHYREDGRQMESEARGAGASSHRRQAHSSYHHESHVSGGGGGAIYGSPTRRAITQQPMHGPAGAAPGAYRPIRHHRVKCCCFNFTWPPWSYEPTAPPQPLYRNI
ncbi:unnamed protein product [Nippostrongylus brasiliensis]|uniref:Periphilin-1 n=1 Tax=Nippostrongylus brasiliensis TaxID=27835 RepID=A0A0N4XWX2_NIPBR|nr:unnamed protein product [Nippostrongylus brasiliensis]